MEVKRLFDLLSIMLRNNPDQHFISAKEENEMEAL
jgi:hypothetical protein